ncbi:MAG: GNAT family N-acetyltransferase [Actinomycetes bacterium]|jgi:RimJ/RimL family protein N-acetyltransferase|nr:MAG: N-acetyltransferase [Actinomycetota bacterium]
MSDHSDPRSRAPRRGCGPDVLTTGRLILWPWHDRYAEDFVRLSGDERVMRLVGSGPWTRAYTLERHRQALRQWRCEGFGLRAILYEGRFAGLVSLSPCPDPVFPAPAREIGWWLDPEFWGRGIATEAALAVRDEAFRLATATLVARCHPDNRPSKRIMGKLGMTFHGTGLDRYGGPCRIYAMPRPAGDGPPPGR